MKNSQRASEERFKLPTIPHKTFETQSNVGHNKRPIDPNTSLLRKKDLSETAQISENQILQVSKLDTWSMNRPTKKSKTTINTHNISFLYKSSVIRKQHKTQFESNFKYMNVQLYIAKVDHELQKIGQINYFSIYKNLQYCSGVYQNHFNTILKNIQKFGSAVASETNQIQLKLQMERQEHIKKVHQLQEKQNQQYKLQINTVRENLQEKQKDLKFLNKLMNKLQLCKIKVLKYCLSLGYDVREEGLIWILKQIGHVPLPEQFPQFLTQKQINFIITKYNNESEMSHNQSKMKNEVLGKTINQAYEYVNRRKRRELSLIKQHQQINRMFAERLSNYSPQKHIYINQQTLQIAKTLQRNKPKPTKYEIIYKETVKKLNKICKEKIHKTEKNKENPKVKEDNTKSKHNLKQPDSRVAKQSISSSNSEFHLGQQSKLKIHDQQSEKTDSRQTNVRKEKRKSTLIIEEFSKMLSLSMNQTKKLQELFTKEERQFEEILRLIRSQKYNEPQKVKTDLRTQFCMNSEEVKARNPISVLSCLVGWKKAQRIIEQQMLQF